MDREEVYKQNRELCMKVPIGTVLNGIGIRVNRKGECLCPNPAHGDKRLGNCRIRPKFNTLQCFACQKVWNPISIVMEWEGLRYVDALRRVADIGGVVLEEVDAFDELADEFAEQKGPKPIQMPNADECEMLGIDMSGIECITGVYPFKPENLPKDVYLREAAVEEYLSKKERDMLDTALRAGKIPDKGDSGIDNPFYRAYVENLPVYATYKMEMSPYIEMRKTNPDVIRGIILTKAISLYRFYEERLKEAKKSNDSLEWEVPFYQEKLNKVVSILRRYK